MKEVIACDFIDIKGMVIGNSILVDRRYLGALKDRLKAMGCSEQSKYKVAILKDKVITLSK